MTGKNITIKQKMVTNERFYCTMCVCVCKYPKCILPCMYVFNCIQPSMVLVVLSNVICTEINRVYLCDWHELQPSSKCNNFCCLTCKLSQLKNNKATHRKLKLFLQLDLILKDPGGDISSFIPNGEWDLIGKWLSTFISDSQCSETMII